MSLKYVLIFKYNTRKNFNLLDLPLISLGGGVQEEINSFKTKAQEE
ncbi:MAG: hypothetical protein BAJALOKI1v1_760011 [Promethearchaeota archaeon]|nr:MAG: hypothetical protein BAJALOKI1v1_760011 [Candidatus Lokiarchaeota archaeon]